jgi:hypothetical protein
MRRAVCLLLGLALLGAGCATYVRRVDGPQIPVPLVQKIPLAVGVYYPPQFRDARPESKRFIQPGQTITEIWPLGHASVATLDAALRGLFESVVEVKQWPPSGEPLKVAGVLVPSMPSDCVEVTLTQTRIRYRVEWFSSKGLEAESWQVTGVSGIDMPMVVPFEALMNEALRSAAANFVVSFYRDPQARAWLAANGVFSVDPMK